MDYIYLEEEKEKEERLIDFTDYLFIEAQWLTKNKCPHHSSSRLDSVLLLEVP